MKPREHSINFEFFTFLSLSLLISNSGIPDRRGFLCRQRRDNPLNAMMSIRKRSCTFACETQILTWVRKYENGEIFEDYRGRCAKKLALYPSLYELYCSEFVGHMKINGTRRLPCLIFAQSFRILVNPVKVRPPLHPRTKRTVKIISRNLNFVD